MEATNEPLEVVEKKSSSIDRLKAWGYGIESSFLTRWRVTPPATRRDVIALCGAVLICAFVVIALTTNPSPHSADFHFAKEANQLKCDGGFIYNATEGLPRPDNPDFYLCTPYDTQPQKLFYQRDANLSKGFSMGALDELVIFNEKCPMDANSTDYQVYIGNWSVLWKRCQDIGLAYMYAEDQGFKFFCCAQYWRFPDVVKEMGGRPTDFERVLLYNETQPIGDGG